MAAQLQIDQAGLPAGTPGVSRTDGLDTGALITLTNTGAGFTTTFELLWVPPGDTTAVASLAPTGPNTWTFTPTVGVYGTYLVRLVEDEGLGSELEERRVIAVRTPNRGLVIPALNEVGNPKASLINDGPDKIENADNNATDFPSTPDINAFQYAAWWRALHEFISSLDDPDQVLTNVAPADVTKSPAVVGVAATAARADHKHDVSTAAPVDVTKLTALEGVATSLSRSDHKHDISTGSAGAAAIGDTVLEGVATSVARSDHTHSFTAGTPVDVDKSANAAGVAGTFSRGDHKHDISTAAVGALVIGDVAAEGSAASLARSDHRHSVAVGVPVNVTKAAGSDGVATTFSRSDHKHDVTTAVPVATGSALSEGSSTALARADHVHTVEGSVGSATGYLGRHVYVNASSLELGQSYWGTTTQAATTFSTASDIPTGNFFRCVLVAAGGGGSAGIRGHSGGGRGGGGGGGGALQYFTASRGQLITLLPLAMSLGLRGIGGLGTTGTTGSVNGAQGSGGGDASFGPWFVFGGGSANTTTSATNSPAGGGGGWRSAGETAPDVSPHLGGLPLPGNSSGSALVVDTQAASLFGGGSGGDSTGTGAGPGGRSLYGGGGGGATAGLASSPGAGGLSLFGAAGGGSGGFANGAGTGNTGGAGGTSGNQAGGTAGTGSTTVGGNGGPGQDTPDPFTHAGTGGGGGGGANNSGTTTTTGGDGGDGGFPGGGGGGGGSSVAGNGVTASSGDGGDGADAVLVIEAYA